MNGSKQPQPVSALAQVSPSSGLSACAPRVLSSQVLMQGGKAVDIAHNGAIYRLQATRQGKLILTK